MTDYGAFRANHMSLWFATAFGYPIIVSEEHEEDILGPHPRLLRSWMRRHCCWSEFLRDIDSIMEGRELQIVEVKAGGDQTIHEWQIEFTPTVVQFVVCKVVAGMEMVAALDAKGIRWRR